LSQVFGLDGRSVGSCGSGGGVGGPETTLSLLRSALENNILFVFHHLLQSLSIKQAVALDYTLRHESWNGK